MNMVFRIGALLPSVRDLLEGVDDEQTSEAEIDELFERTRPIGNAINALAQAELAVAAVDELPPDVAARLDQILAVFADEIQRGR